MQSAIGSTNSSLGGPDVFEAVQSGATSYGVVPFENSTHGVVTFTLEHLGDRENAYPDLQVCGEIYLDVHHFLMGRKNPGAEGSDTTAGSAPAGSAEARRGVPLVDLSHVQKIYSHPQALGQTTIFTSKFLRGVGTIDVTSTSRAAELAAADPTGASAAIAGEIAAGMHGLDILARCIENRDDNTTRFFVIRRGASVEGRPPLPAPLEPLRNGIAPPPPPPGGDPGAPRPYKSLVAFTVPHHETGALAVVLDCFRRCSLNLTSINSMPSQVAPFQYIFLVEFDGSKFADPAKKVQEVLEGLDKAARSWRFLGSWERQR